MKRSTMTLVLAIVWGLGPGLASAEEMRLHRAAAAGDTKQIAALQAAGEAIDARNAAGDTPLHLAAARLQLEAMSALIAQGADVCATNAAGQTPLHVVGRSGREDSAAFESLRATAADLLIAAGADPNALDHAARRAWPPVRAVPTQPSGYPTYAQVVAQLESYEATYPTLCWADSIGASTGDDIWAIRISDNIGLDEDEPEFKWVSTMHGDETVGLVMCLNLIDLLLTQYGTDPRLTRLVDELDIWIVPTMNPWGYVHTTRYNANGIDLNRAFPEGAPPNPEANSTAGRQPEVATIMNWSFGRSFSLGANLHGGALVANYPFDNPGSESQYTPYNDLYLYMAEQYARNNLPMWNSPYFENGITNGYDWYIVEGGMQDWNYRYMGCNAMTFELSDDKNPPYAEMPQFWSENRESMLAYMETALIGIRGIVTDADSGTPLDATVRILGRDHDIYTDPDVGDYHRMALPGTYDMQVVATGYDTVVAEGVEVLAGDARRVDFALVAPPTMTAPNGGEVLAAGLPTNVTWSGSTQKAYHVQVTDNLDDVVQVPDDFERAALGADYVTSGDADWFVTTTDSHGGVRSARAGGITHNQSTTLERTVAGGLLSFWYTVDSEAGYDYFSFYVDGQLRLSRAGNVPWTQYSETLTPGTHTLTWTYRKDVYLSTGADTVWIDDVIVTEDQTAWQDVVNPTAVGATSVSWTPTAPGTDYAMRVRAVYAAGVYGQWDVSDAAFEVAVAPVCAGDANCDGFVNFRDIDFFVAGMNDSEADWRALFADPNNPGCTFANLDCSGDGYVNFRDIDPFVGAMNTSCP